MKTCVVLGSRPIGQRAAAHIQPGDTVIAVDAGWQHARALDIVPDMVMGDFDSAPKPPEGYALHISPAEKDDTDTMLAVKHALALGMERVVLLGCTGGRPDHTYANIQTLLHLAQNGVGNLLADEETEMFCIPPGEVFLNRLPNHYVSVFAVGGIVHGVCLEGLKFPLVNATLTPDMPLGVSNEFAAPVGVIRHREGHLLIMTTPKDGPGEKE